MTGLIQKIEEILHFLYFYAFVTQEIPTVLKLRLKSLRALLTTGVPSHTALLLLLPHRRTGFLGKQTELCSIIRPFKKLILLCRSQGQRSGEEERAFLTAPGAYARQMDPSRNKLTQLPAWLSTSSSKLPCICLCFRVIRGQSSFEFSSVLDMN